jgi:U3 small nucleolar RNA-associated protein 14
MLTTYQRAMRQTQNRIAELNRNISNLKKLETLGNNQNKWGQLSLGNRHRLHQKHELEKRDLEIKRLKKLLEAPPPEETDSLIEEKTDSVSESESESESEESASESEESESETDSEESDSDYEPDEEDNSRQDRMQACSHCKELGHKITRCPLRWNTVIRNLRCNQEVLRDYVLESE